MKFTELNLHEWILKGIEDAKFTDCTPVQEKTFDQTLKGRDVYVQSQTGSGKTAAFLITIFNLFLTSDKYKHKKALVIVPTRELAVQVEKDAKLLGKHCNFRMGSFFGGMGYDKQEKLLEEDVNLYIGTPGRLIDFYKSGKLPLGEMEILVIDEADRMFDMGFIPDIRYMIKKMIPSQERLTMLYSATLSQRVKLLAWEYMNNPVEIEIEPEHITVDTITQELYHIASEDKFRLLLGILKKENPNSALIFTNTKKMAEIVSRRLSGNGYVNEYISGDLPQKKRLKIIDAIKAGKTEILVATDVAARGLHIEALDLVINYDLPDDPENYVHRIGRTARAGREGKAIALACERYVYNLESIEKLIGMNIPSIMPPDEMLLPDASHFKAASAGRDQRDRGGRPSDRRREREDRGRRKPGKAVSETAEAVRSAVTRTAAGPEKSPEKRREPAAQAKAPAPRKERGRRERAPEKRQPAPARSESAPARMDKDASIQDRLEYYRKKYGENFSYPGAEKEERGRRPAKTKARETAPRKQSGETGLLKKLTGLFKKKK